MTAINVYAIALIKNLKYGPRSPKGKANNETRVAPQASKPNNYVKERIEDIEYGFQT